MLWKHEPNMPKFDKNMQVLMKSCKFTKKYDLYGQICSLYKTNGFWKSWHANATLNMPNMQILMKTF